MKIYNDNYSTFEDKDSLKIWYVPDTIDNRSNCDFKRFWEIVKFVFMFSFKYTFSQ